MDKHIEVVKKWLADNDSVSQTELEYNRVAAYRARAAAGRSSAHATDAVYQAAHAAYAAPYGASADYWVKRYEELTNE
tara:strand:+ start:395 stop:628 length:234 start_codon:yes stop_codon:yes gene_type:complete